MLPDQVKRFAFPPLAIIFLLATVVSAQDFKGFNVENAIINLDEIKDGGPPKDGIPAIDHPKFITSQESDLDYNDKILGVFHQGIAKAYPIAILNYHEVVNDYFGAQPVVITYCPLCGSGIAFDAQINGGPKTFGVSGLLYNSDVLLYDRETESLWSQLMMQGISGHFVGQKLSMLPIENTTWEKWKGKHPKTWVLSYDTGFERDYHKNPYPGYESSEAIYFPVKGSNNIFHPKEVIIGIAFDGNFKAYPFSELEKTKTNVITDEFEGAIFKISYDAENKSAEVFDSSGEPFAAITNYWFAWYAFHPDTIIYRHP